MQQLNGSIALLGDVRAQKTILKSNATEDLSRRIFAAWFGLNSKGYVWHPNFMSLDLDFEFAPGVQREQFLVIPNRTETRTAEKLRFQTYFFKKRPLSFNIYFNLNHALISREFTTNVEMRRRDYGGSIFLRSVFLPVTIDFSRNKWEQRELQTGRVYLNWRGNFRTEFSKSFGTLDDHRLVYSFDDFTREFTKDALIRNKINSIDLRNNIFFDGSRRRGLNSQIWYTSQVGSNTFDRFQVNEHLFFQLPQKFKFLVNYQYFGFSQFNFDSKQHNFISRLEHRLYLSLRSYIFYERNDLRQTVFKEYRRAGGFGFKYRKNIPTGQLSMSFEYRLRNEKRDSRPFELRIFSEEHLLDDNEIVLLDNPFVDPGSVIVTDETKTIIYREFIDYILIPRGDFLEIRRAIGGQIDNGTTVYVDYRAEKQLSYNFDAINKTFGVSLFLFRNRLELYYRSNEQNYDNVDIGPLKILKIVSQKVYGSRLSINSIAVGFEYDRMNSNIVPYRSSRYFITFNRYLNYRIRLSLTGDWREYELIQTRELQKFASVYGSLVYNLSRLSQLKLLGNYRFQEGRGIDLNLNSLRGEFVTRYHNVFITLGLEYFRRDFSGEKIYFNNAYVRIERKF